MRRAVLLVLVAVLAGCSTRVGGEAAPGAEVSPPASSAAPAATASTLLGDLPEFDPCSLTDPEVYSAFGDAEWGVPNSLDYCTVEVTPEDGGRIVLRVGQLDDLVEHPNAPEVESLDDGLSIVQPAADASLCTLLLVFADKVTLEVTGEVVEGSAPRLCAVVSSGLDEVVRRVEAGDVGQREVPDRSLQPIDPCSLLEDSTVHAQPGMSGAERYEPPAQHQCRWSASPGPEAMTVRLVFSVGAPPSASQEGAEERQIAGRDTVVTPVPQLGTMSYCLVDAPHLEFEGPGEERLVEIASVWVRTPPGQADLACQVGTSLAAEVWPLLPSS